MEGLYPVYFRRFSGSENHRVYYPVHASRQTIREIHRSKLCTSLLPAALELRRGSWDITNWYTMLREGVMLRSRG